MRGRTARIYIRVSTTLQASEGVSLEAQEARARAWATANGYAIRGVHVDAGISGKRADNRPALQEALATVCREQGALVVYSLSRMARSVRDTLSIADRLSKAGADLVSLSESIDTTTAAGKLLFRMLAVLAEFERDVVSERTSMALSHKRDQGRRISGRAPLGFRFEDGRVVPDKAEGAVLARVRLMRRRLSMARVVAILNAEGVQLRGGRFHVTTLARWERGERPAA